MKIEKILRKFLPWKVCSVESMRCLSGGKTTNFPFKYETPTSPSQTVTIFLAPSVINLSPALTHFSNLNNGLSFS